VNSSNLQLLKHPEIYGRTQKKFLTFAYSKEIAKHLTPGNLVERHLIEGDLVLFNRKTSIHMISIKTNRARILEGRTFRFNECL
jgi:DNA-directed RNA polymerase III subunit RPC1